MFSSSPKSPPVRQRSSAIEHIPFSTNLSHLSVELGKTDSAASSPCRSELSCGGFSFRDQEQQKKSLEEENFKLKLRVYMLEERLQRQDSPDRSNKVVAELRVQSAALREELAQKGALLRRASDTLEVLEQRQSEQQALLKQGEAERALLEDTLEDFEAQYRSEVEQHEATEAERAGLEGTLQLLRQEQAEQRQRQQQQAEARSSRLQEAVDRLQQRCEQAEQEAERAAASLSSLKQCHVDELRRRERAEADKRRLEETVKSLEKRYSEEVQRREMVLEENRRLQNLMKSLQGEEKNRPETYAAEKPQTPAECGGQGQQSAGAAAAAAAAAAARLQRQLAAAAGERRREQAVAAAALQLQTERARSLQTSVQGLSEQVRRGQAELAQCRAERDRLQRLQQDTPLTEPALSSTEGVEVIQEPQTTAVSREDLLQSYESPCTDLAGWLGPMPGLKSDSLEEPQLLGELTATSRRVNQTQESAAPRVPTVPPAPLGDNSDWETWSEPDRSVSQARIGLNRSSLEPPAEAWRAADAWRAAEVTTDTEGKTAGRRGQRQTAAEVRELEGRIDGLQQVRDGLWAEVAIYQKLVTAAGGTAEQQGVTVSPELLADVQQLHQRLEDAVTASDRLSRQRETECWTAPPPELTLALTITQEELAESSQKLSAAQQRNQKLRTRLQHTRDKLQLTELERDQLHQQCDDGSEQMRTLRERFEQMEADREQLAETVRRQSEQQQTGALRHLRHQLERSTQRQQELEQLVRQLTGQLRQLPAAVGGGVADAADTEQRVRRAESQLLTLGRQRLRLQAEVTRLRSRSRLLRSEESVRESHQVEAEAAAADQTERQQLLTQLEAALVSQQQQQQQRQGSSSGTAESQALRELNQQLEKAHAEIDRMRAKAQEYDEAGHSCPESTRSCELPLAPSSPGGPRLSSHSESDPHDPLRTSRGPPAYSSPDLGIESDCQRCSSRTSSTTVQSQRSDAADQKTPLPSGGEASPAAAAAAAGELSTLAATRAALQQALLRLGRAEHSKAAVQSAVYRGIGQTQLLVSRARGGLLRPVAEGQSVSER